jgi:glycogen operon protein
MSDGMSGDIGRGRPYPLGAHHDGRGINFAVCSAHAMRIEVVVFDAAGKTARRQFALPARSGDVFHGYLPDAVPGLVYGLRAHGPWSPSAGHRFDATKLLLDPYAREIVGRFDWADGADRHGVHTEALKARVIVDDYDWRDDAPPQHAAEDLLLYELHVRGFSRLQPRIPAELRGSYRGLAHPESIRHLESLGVTAVSLLPVQQHLDEKRLVGLGLVNYWGYNTLGYFCPEPGLASEPSRAALDPGRAVRDEFRDMVRALHAAGIEVILDVVFNHTCEGDEQGPTLSWRGLDNAVWYRPDAQDPARYVNDSGCGNVLDLRQPRVVQFVMDVLRYWVGQMHVDGFRFDLAPGLARGDHGFDYRAPLLQAMAQDPLLATVKCIAEPWDIGPGGYRLGGFPRHWLEWNDRFRDDVRRYWLGADRPGGGASRGEFARRLCGSADIFEPAGRAPASSVNYVTAHDGFTLRDLVSYTERHNLANGEENRDGHAENHGTNLGVEGDTDDVRIIERRLRLQRALLATLMLSLGTPMLGAGSELGHTQRGNNNAYCQDNAISWLDWDRADAELLQFCARLAQLRREHLPLGHLWHAESEAATGEPVALAWFTADGHTLGGEAWHDPVERAFFVTVHQNCALLFNPAQEARRFTLPAGRWRVLLDSAQPRCSDVPAGEPQHEVPAHGLQWLRREEVA